MTFGKYWSKSFNFRYLRVWCPCFCIMKISGQFVHWKHTLCWHVVRNKHTICSIFVRWRNRFVSFEKSWELLIYSYSRKLVMCANLSNRIPVIFTSRLTSVLETGTAPKEAKEAIPPGQIIALQITSHYQNKTHVEELIVKCLLSLYLTLQNYQGLKMMRYYIKII